MSQTLNEQRIKRLLVRHIKQQDWRRTDALIPEYFVERASRRADMVVVDRQLRAYEIKSDVDHLSRLSGQIEVYRRYFESVTVVCTERHLESVLAQTESTIGVLCVSPDGFTEHRAATSQDLLDLDSWLSHLPITAMREALVARGIPCPRTGRSEVLSVAREHLMIEDARATVFAYLKNKKRKQRIALSQTKLAAQTLDPLVEHRTMLRDYLHSRGIVLPDQIKSSQSAAASISPE